jgi:hypothetical protein
VINFTFVLSCLVPEYEVKVEGDEYHRIDPDCPVVNVFAADFPLGILTQRVLMRTKRNLVQK